jgi:sigma-B regulation protein RsbU (phosphoserine phosphatase)
MEFSAICIPAQAIGGDYYDAIRRSDGRVGFLVADISGKGISAAILMANLQALFRVLMKEKETLQEVSWHLNSYLYEATESSRFATSFLAEWSPDQQLLTYVNAGHQAPLLLGSIAGAQLTCGGPPLGMFGNSEYQIGCLRVEESDMMLLFSDGIVEARCRDEELGAERLNEILMSLRKGPVAQMPSLILKAVTAWAEGEAEDDMTLVVIKFGRKGQAVEGDDSDCL